MRFGLVITFMILYFTSASQDDVQKLRSLSIKEGLTSNAVNCLLKDSRGFLWVGTAEGLNRFDGTHFISFFTDDKDQNSLSGNNILDLLEFSPGKLLIATNNGLSVLDIYDGKFENDRIQLSALQKGSNNMVRSLFQDRKKRVLVNYMGKIDVFDQQLKFLFCLTDLTWTTDLKGVIINKEKCFQDSQEQIWIPTDNKGICIVNENKQAVYCWQNNPNHFPFLEKFATRAFYYNEAGQIVWYAAFGSGLMKYDLKTKQLSHQAFDIPFTNESASINTISNENNGKLFCAGGSFLYEVDTNDLRYQVVNKKSQIPFITSTSLYDSEFIWIGTESKGLIQYSIARSFVEEIPLPFPIKDYTNFCTGIAASPNGILYLTYAFDGLVELDTKTRQTKTYKMRGDEGKLQSVYRICADKQNQFWVGSIHGIYLFDVNKKIFYKPPDIPQFVQKLSPMYIFCDSRGNMWFSFVQPNAIGCYNSNEKKFSYYENYVVDGHPVFNKDYRITRITEDNNGNIWMISFDKGGILSCNLRTGKWRSFPAAEKNKNLLANKELNAIMPGDDHTLWISSVAGLGLVHYDYLTEDISFVTRKHGLLSDNIIALTKDENGNLYLVSANGVNLYSPKNNEIRSLSKNNGEINWSYAFIQFYDSTNKQLVYGLNDRIVLIKNKAWQTLSKPLKTYIDYVVVNNELQHINTNSQKLSLKNFQKNLTINFASNNYSENSSLSYAYKLQPVDKDWHIVQNLNAANYSNLSPGSYVFLIKAKNQSGDWGPVNDSLKIHINKAIWQTWWFKIAVAFLLVMVTWFLVRLRVRSIRHEAGLKQKIAETEMMALRAQMNPHFIFNCINSIDALIQSNDKYHATIYLNKFAKLIRNILDSSKANLVTLAKDFETLKLYVDLELLRNENKFTAELKADDTLLQDDYKVPPLIIQPYVENAILHGLRNRNDNEGRLYVSISKKKGQLQYVIEDNGVGRNNNHSDNRQQQNAYGVQMSADRIKLFNKEEVASVEITDLKNNGRASGTKVTVLLNIQ